MATRNGTLCQTCGSTTNSLESTDGARSGLRSAVAPNDHKSYTRLRKILGLGNKQAVKEWMDSKAFKPAFQRVYNNWIVVQQDAARQARKFRRCGPDLRAVADDIDDPYAVAEMRYTSLMGVDSLNFDPLHDSATLRAISGNQLKKSYTMQLTLLPSELQAHIVSGLNNRDKKSLRLTCRTLRDRSPLRIDRVFLSANVRNVEVFRAIANHEIFRKGVTEVIWDDALLAESNEQYEDEFYCEGDGLPDCDETCPVWFLWACRENLSWLTSRKGNDVDDLPQHLERAKEMDAQLPLNESYAYYQGLLMQQESVLSTQADIEALKYGITRFPALKRITITPAAHGALYTPLYETPMIRAFPYGFNYLIPRAWPTVEPGFSPCEAPPWDTEAEKNKWRGFRIVLRTLAEQEHHISEFILDVNGLCTGLNCHVFDEPCEEYEDLVALLRKPGFNRIDLGLLVSTQQDEGWPSFRSGHLKHALGEAKDLQHVSLCTDLGANQEVDVPEEDSDVIPLRTIFPINRWQQLQHLGISGFVVRQDDLISLLAALPASLLSVELSFLHFYGDDNYRSLLCDMRDKLGWRDRSASERPKVIIGGGGGGLVAVHVGRATWIEDEVSEFLYGDGLNPFGREGDRFSPNQIRLGFGLERDEFEPCFERPWAQYDELRRLGYYPDVRLQYEEWKKSLSGDLST